MGSLEVWEKNTKKNAIALFLSEKEEEKLIINISALLIFLFESKI